MILKLWRFLFGGCEHKWVALIDGGIVREGKTLGHHYEQRCANCSKIRYFNTWIF